MLKGFIEFVRKQGVIGLAIAFVLGGAVTKVVAAFVQDIVNPIVGLALGKAGTLSNAAIAIGPVKILWGHFVATLIDFAIIAAVIYFVFKWLRLDRLDYKEEQK